MNPNRLTRAELRELRAWREADRLSKVARAARECADSIMADEAFIYADPAITSLYGEPVV